VNSGIAGAVDDITINIVVVIVIIITIIVNVVNSHMLANCFVWTESKYTVCE